MSERIMIIDDKQSLVEILETALSVEGYEISSFTSGLEAAKSIETEIYDLVFCDVRLPDHNGMDILKSIRSRSPETAVIMITAYGSIENAIECMKLGADDYVTKPFNLEEIRAIASKGLEKVRLRRENIALRREVSSRYEFGSIIGKSKQMQDIFDRISRVSPADVSVMITGETGTGKELVSKAIHYNSNRSRGPFIAVNCAAIPENLLESELFGHVRGAFTGAVSNKHGMFEEAGGGTLLLDEITELHPSLQAKLLRTLDEGKIRRVGDTKLIPIDIRLICSTNRNLEEEVKSGRFRLDLYHRIRVVEINIPPLRERREDIPLLARHFLEKICIEHGRPPMSFDPGALRVLVGYAWVGNVRELINLIEQSVLLCEDNAISDNMLHKLMRPIAEAPVEMLELNQPLKKIMARYEREVLIRALESNGGNRKETANRLGISERSLYYKMEEYELS